MCFQVKSIWSSSSQKIGHVYSLLRKSRFFLKWRIYTFYLEQNLYSIWLIHPGQHLSVAIVCEIQFVAVPSLWFSRTMSAFVKSSWRLFGCFLPNGSCFRRTILSRRRFLLVLKQYPVPAALIICTRMVLICSQRRILHTCPPNLQVSLSC